MFEYHGWAVVRDSPGETDEQRLYEIVQKLEHEARGFNDGSGMSDIRWINGSCFVSFAGNPNHRHDRVFGWFQWFAGNAPGSFGLMYICDDEDVELQNAFRVYCLRRGQVIEQTDPFLSPCVPTIEDPVDSESR